MIRLKRQIQAITLKQVWFHSMHVTIKQCLGFLTIILLLIHHTSARSQDASDAIQPEESVPLPNGDKSLVTGTSWIIATANPHASEAGAKILRTGGNAIDAMVAVQTTLGLTEPQSSGLGGGGFLVYWDNEAKRLTTFDARETAPANINPRLFQRPNGNPLTFYNAVVSGLSVGVPGVPKLLHEAHKKYGSKPWSELLDHAISLSENGFKVSPRLAGLIEQRRQSLSWSDTTRNYFFDENGKAKKRGTLLKNPAYAQTLRLYQKEGADVFYKGVIAEQIVDAVQNAQERQGTLALSDLAHYRIKERDPVCSNYRLYSICGMGPPSSGAIAINQILGILEPFDLATGGPDSTENWQLIADATRLAFTDRSRYLADIDFVTVPVKGLLKKDYLKTRSQILKAGKKLDAAKPGMPTYDHALNYADDQSLERPSTSHFVIHDTKGNIVSMTASIENAFGSNLMAAGFLLNNQLTDFSFETHKDGRPIANAAAPGKRPRSSMSPTIIFKDGKPQIALGTSGGSRIIPYIANSIIAIIDWGMNIQEAIDLPHVTNRFGIFALEANTKAVDHQKDLENLGYDAVVIPLNSGNHGISIKDGKLEGGADPRREGLVIAE